MIVLKVLAGLFLFMALMVLLPFIPILLMPFLIVFGDKILLIPMFGAVVLYFYCRKRGNKK